METHLQHQMLLRVPGLCELHRQQKPVLVGSWAFRLDLRVVAQAAQRILVGHPFVDRWRGHCPYEMGRQVSHPHQEYHCDWAF